MLEELDHYSESSGVYLMKDAKGSVLYVGKAKNLKNRLKQYFSESGDQRPIIPFLIPQIAKIDTIIVSSEKEALLLENTLIKKHQPKYNAILKDDKTFISLMINNKHKWPMIRLVRYKGKPKEEGLYFGPYTNAFAARGIFELLTKLFPLRQCSDEELKRRTRPCLLYEMKRCIAPCVNKCTKEAYDSLVTGAIQFLKGQDKEILKRLQKEMQEASKSLEFERAAALLQTIRQIEHVTEANPLVHRAEGKDTDALAFLRSKDKALVVLLLFREGKLIGSEQYLFSEIVENDEELLETFILQHYQKSSSLPKELLLPLPLPQNSALKEIFPIAFTTPRKGDKHALVELALENAKALFKQSEEQQELKEKMLLDLQELCSLNRYPKRIECFDTSNISGSDLTAAMVAFTDGMLDKKRIRTYHIKNIHKGDDYGALHQVLSRRLLRAEKEEDLPDLLIVDGGKGQLNVALDVLKELNIASVDVIAVAKEKGRHDKGLSQEKIFLPHRSEPIIPALYSSLLFLLQQIRDATHERAIRFHRRTRTKRTIKTQLDTIPGIGPVKRKRLLSHFGSLKRVCEATDKELQEVQGITRKDVAAIKNAKLSLND